MCLHVNSISTCENWSIITFINYVQICLHVSESFRMFYTKLSFEIISQDTIEIIIGKFKEIWLKIYDIVTVSSKNGEIPRFLYQIFNRLNPWRILWNYANALLTLRSSKFGYKKDWRNSAEHNDVHLMFVDLINLERMIFGDKQRFRYSRERAL